MVDSGRWLEGKGQGQVSALADSRQSLMVGARVLASQSTGFDEGGSSDNEPQKAASVCISDAQGQREPLSRDAGLDGREKVGTTVCPSPRCKPQPDVGKDQAGSGPPGRQTSLAKLPFTSQTSQGPLGVAPPRQAPLQVEPTSAGPHSSLGLSPSDSGPATGAEAC